MATSILKTKNWMLSKQPDELARIRVLTGPDHGTIFVISAFPITIGRGEENHIVLTDLKASRRHAEITMINDEVHVRDIGSSHGIAINGKLERQSTLKSSDKITLGESVLEFVRNEAGSTKVINFQTPTAAQAGTGSSGYTKFMIRPEQYQNKAATSSMKSETFLERNKKLMLTLGALMFVATMLPTVEQKAKTKKHEYDVPEELVGDRGLASLQPPAIDENSKRNAENYFKDGFREYRSKNYLRARIAFETALQLNPGHPLANLYLGLTRNSMEAEAKQEFEDASKDVEAGRYEEALSKFESVKRLYERDQAHPIFKEANTRIEDLNKKMKEMDKY